MMIVNIALRSSNAAYYAIIKHFITAMNLLAKSLRLRNVFNFHRHLSWETYQAPTACRSTLTSEHDSREVSQHAVWTLHSEKVSQKVAVGLKGHGLY